MLVKSVDPKCLSNVGGRRKNSQPSKTTILKSSTVKCSSRRKNDPGRVFKSIALFAPSVSLILKSPATLFGMPFQVGGPGLQHQLTGWIGIDGEGRRVFL